MWVGCISNMGLMKVAAGLRRVLRHACGHVGHMAPQGSTCRRPSAAACARHACICPAGLSAHLDVGEELGEEAAGHCGRTDKESNSGQFEASGAGRHSRTGRGIHQPASGPAPSARRTGEQQAMDREQQAAAREGDIGAVQGREPVGGVA